VFFSSFQSSALASGLGDDYIVTSRTYDVTGMRHHHSYSMSPPSLPVRVDTSFRIQLLRLGMDLIPVSTFDRDVAVHMELLGPTCAVEPTIHAA
jgi:hypothetical protein